MQFRLNIIFLHCCYVMYVIQTKLSQTRSITILVKNGYVQFISVTITFNPIVGNQCFEIQVEKCRGDD